MTEDSDNYDQTESDAFKVQHEFEQLAITLTGLQSLRDAYSHSMQSLAILRGLKEQPDITGVLCQIELKRRSALDYIQTAEINEELQAQLKVLETLYSELLMESDRQKRNQSSKPESVVKPTVMQGRPSLTMKMPTFDGNILRWKDFGTMFSGRLENEPHLTDADKGNLLVQAITDPAARRRAEQLIANHASLDVGSGLVRDEYENLKILYGHHFESAFKPDLYKDNRDDLIRLQLRIDATQRGLKDSKGWSIEQILTHTWAQMMATPLAKEWRTFTQEDPNPPDLKALQKFVMVRKTIASAAILVAPNNKFDKAEKVNKPKQNPCPKKNSLQIERTSKTADKTSLNRIDGCPECGDKHYLFACQQFRDSTVSHMLDVTKDNNLCFNCLSPSHRVCDCYSLKRCKRCKGKHHSLLHKEASNNQNGRCENDTAQEDSSTLCQHTFHSNRTRYFRTTPLQGPSTNRHWSRSIASYSTSRQRTSGQEVQRD